MLPGKEPLSESMIGPSHCPDLTAGPGLLRNPRDRINPVLCFIEQGSELALRAKTSPAVLQDNGIACLDRSWCIDDSLHHRWQVFVVG